MSNRYKIDYVDLPSQGEIRLKATLYHDVDWTIEGDGDWLGTFVDERKRDGACHKLRSRDGAVWWRPFDPSDAPHVASAKKLIKGLLEETILPCYVEVTATFRGISGSDMLSGMFHGDGHDPLKNEVDGYLPDLIANAIDDLKVELSAAASTTDSARAAGLI